MDTGLSGGDPLLIGQMKIAGLVDDKAWRVSEMPSIGVAEGA